MLGLCPTTRPERTREGETSSTPFGLIGHCQDQALPCPHHARAHGCRLPQLGVPLSWGPFLNIPPVIIPSRCFAGPPNNAKGTVPLQGLPLSLEITPGQGRTAAGKQTARPSAAPAHTAPVPSRAAPCDPTLEMRAAPICCMGLYAEQKSRQSRHTGWRPHARSAGHQEACFPRSANGEGGRASVLVAQS